MNLITIPGHSATPVDAPTRRARCSDGHGTLAHLFFSTDDVEIARAKAVCRPCALASECLQGALHRHEAYGVWGGTLLVDGVPVALPIRRGRPPAAPRVEYIADEVPVPDHLVA